MYSAPPVAVPATTTSRKSGLAGVPLVALCCLALILLAIAATIVLALIPIYLPRKNVTPVTEPLRYFTADVSGPALDDAVLDGPSRNNIAAAIARANKLPANAVEVPSASIATVRNRRRRGMSLTRIRRRPTSAGNQLMFGTFRFIRTVCNPCILIATTFTETVVIFINGIAIVLTIQIIIVETVINVPPVLPPSTAAPTTQPTISANVG